MGARRRCRICGCDEAFGCLVIGSRCHWAEYDLCSVCDELGVSDAERAARLGTTLRNGSADSPRRSERGGKTEAYL